MLKSTLIVTVLAFATLVSVNSCKKKYRCVCEDGLVVNSYEHKLTKAAAEDQKAKCQAADSTCVFERDKRK